MEKMYFVAKFGQQALILNLASSYPRGLHRAEIVTIWNQ